MHRRQITSEMLRSLQQFTGQCTSKISQPLQGELSTCYLLFYRRGKHTVLPTLLCNLVLDPSTADGKRFSLFKRSQKCLLGCKMPWASSDNCLFSRHRNS